MHYTLFTRRLVFGLLLIFMLVAGWFLRGMVLAATHSEMEHSAYEGAIPQPGSVPICHGLPDTMHSKIGVLGLTMGATAAVLAAS